MRFTAQTLTAFVSAVLFVALAGVLALAPVPFVTWAPGQSYDVLGGEKPVIAVKGAKTYPTQGSLDLTTVSVTRVDSRLSLPEALLSYWLPGRDTLPRDAVYQPSSSAEQVQEAEQHSMADSKSEAVVAALRQADQPVRELPMVVSVTIGAPAHGNLLPDDLIEKVDGQKVTTTDRIRTLIRRHKVGETVTFVVLRGHERKQITVSTVASNEDASVPVIGVTFDIGYDYAPRVTFAIDPAIGGPSAGLVFALGVYDKITPGELVGRRTVAGTGTIDAAGQVGVIGGAKEKLASARAHGATLFLLPAGNCKDLDAVPEGMTVVKVKTLHDAITVLEKTSRPGAAPRLDRCVP